MEPKWWHDKIAYQIYPKSFMDSNSDGIGDIPGIIRKLDYLADLGVDIIWISPVYPSPLVDGGYDISDYYNIDPRFGTMDDFDLLLQEAKKRGMCILMDLVINHCSDQHPWFQKALADPYGEYAGYFWFRKGKNGNPPNNMRSYFGGSVWEPVPGTDLYYLHMFAKEQPDFNWENPVLRQKLYDMINWWLDKGLAGFRIDAIMNIKKDPAFPDYPPDRPDGTVFCAKMIHETEGIGTLLNELKEKTMKPHDAFTVGEVFDMDPAMQKDFIGDDGYFSTMFDFSSEVLFSSPKGWHHTPDISIARWRDTVFASQLASGQTGLLANIIENHDEPRGASRYLPSYAQNSAGIKLLGTVSVLLRGLPFLYQGQEIGMTNYPFPSIDAFDDISTKDHYRDALSDGLSAEEALRCCCAKSRDNARTPMQWDASEHAGFTDGTPWLPVHPNHVDVNVADESADPDSVLNYYKKLLRLRKSAEYRTLFSRGDFSPIWQETDYIFAYLRKEGAKTVLVAGNFGRERAVLTLPAMQTVLLLSNLPDVCCTEDGTLILPACGAAVLALTPAEQEDAV